MDSLASRLTISKRASSRYGWCDERGSPAQNHRPLVALRELGATVAVEGSLQRDGQTIHLMVNLVNTKTLRQIGSVTLEDRAATSPRSKTKPWRAWPS